MSSKSRRDLEAWLRTIDVQGDVIDIGGSQYPIKGRTKSWKVGSYKILDLEVPHECKVKPDIELDIQNNELPALTNEGEFDIAFCIEVSEYWFNPIIALENIKVLLKKGGILYISFHFLYPVHPPENKDYLRYTRHGVRKLIEEAGFSIEEIRPRYFESPETVKILYDNEGMRGTGKNSGEIHKEQGYLIKAVKID